MGLQNKIVRLDIVSYSKYDDEVEAEIFYLDKGSFIMNRKSFIESEKRGIKYYNWLAEQIETKKRKENMRNKRNIAIASAITLVICVIVSLL